MTKTFCDVCEAEIKVGEFAGSFDKIEASLGTEQPYSMRHWDLCQPCAIQVKNTIEKIKK